MIDELLPLPQRLALHYAPGPARAPTLALLALDARLSELVAKANEPLLAQLRLAWWRDELGKPQAERARGDPVLDALEAWAGEEQALAGLVEGWEHLIGDAPLPASSLEKFADGRGNAFAALARLTGQGQSAKAAGHAARIWALADFAAHSRNAEERSTALQLGGALARRAGAKLSRPLRAVAVLRGLGRRAIERGGGPLVGGRRDVLATMRLGMLGR